MNNKMFTLWHMAVLTAVAVSYPFVATPFQYAAITLLAAIGFGAATFSMEK